MTVDEHESRAARRRAQPGRVDPPERSRLGQLLASPRRVRVPAEPDFAPVRRHLLAWLGLACGGCGLVSALPGLPALLAAALALAFVGAGPGALIVLGIGRLPRLLALVTIPALGTSVVALLVSAELAIGWYHARLTTLVLSLGCAGAGAGALAWRRRRTGSWPGKPPPIDARAWVRRVRHRAPDAAHSLPLLLAATGVIVTLLSVPWVRRSHTSSFGLLPEVPSMGVAVLAALAAFLLALRARSRSNAWCALVALVLSLRADTLLATAAPVYAWTYQHLGVIDWFNHSGVLARDVDVYSNWPGALAFFAWFTESTGLSRFTLAHVFVLGYHLVTIVVVYVLARSFRRSRAESLVATGLVEALNWVGQDYLSPQAFAFVLALVVVSLLLTGRDRHYQVCASISALVIFVAIVWSHQLTPVWLLATAVMLYVIGFLRPTSLLAAMTLAVAVMVVINWTSLADNFTGVSGDVVRNSSGNVTTAGSAGQDFTSATVRLLAIVLWLSALAIGGWQLRRGGSIRRREIIALLVLAFSPMTMLLTSYGGEVVFRAYLYSLPGIAIVLAPVITQWVTGSLRSAVAGAAAVTALTACAVQGSWGNWAQGVVPEQDLSLQLRLEHDAGERGQIAGLVGGVMPDDTTWRYVPRERNNVIVDQLWGIENLYTGTDGSDHTPVDALTYATFIRMGSAPMYVVVSGSMRRHARQFGSMAPEAFSNIERRLVSDGWYVVYRDTTGTAVYATEGGRVAWASGGAPSTKVPGDANLPRR